MGGPEAAVAGGARVLETLGGGERTGKTNADIMREYRQEIAKQEMAKMNMTTFEELNLYFNEHPDKIPRDYVITRKVRPRC